jgi:hypothetical protein
VLTENSESRTERLLTVETVLARAIADPGVHDDSISRNDAFDLGACRVHDADGVRAQNPRRRDDDSGQAADHEQIEAIERGRENAYADVVGTTELRLGNVVAELDAVHTAVAIDCECLHVWAPLYSSR